MPFTEMNEARASGPGLLLPVPWARGPLGIQIYGVHVACADSQSSWLVNMLRQSSPVQLHARVKMHAVPVQTHPCGPEHDVE